MTAIECKHGQLARSCDLCEIEDERAKFAELIGYLRMVAGTVPTTTEAGEAFMAASDYIDMILRGDYDMLPWGVDEVPQLGRGSDDG